MGTKAELNRKGRRSAKACEKKGDLGKDPVVPKESLSEYFRKLREESKNGSRNDRVLLGRDGFGVRGDDSSHLGDVPLVPRKKKSD